MSRATERHRRDDRGGTALTLLGVAAAVVVLLVAVFLGIGQLVNDDAEVPVTATQQVQQGELTERAFEDVEPGVTKEDLQTSLRPVEPVDAAVLDRYDLRAPETVSASCVYYEGEDLPDEALYRFCFEDDVLVDKTFVLQGEPGPGTGAALSAS